MLTHEDVRDYVKKGMSVTNTAVFLRAAGYRFDDKTLRSIYADIKQEPETPGELVAPDSKREWAAGSTHVFTCAQNNTKLHDNFWDSLMHYVDAHDATLHVSKFLYMTTGLASSNAKPGTRKAQEDVWYDPRIIPYTSDKSLQIAKDLVWCGELNIIPTRVHPISTLKTYTQGASGIIPHVKMRMDSVPRLANSDPVFMYTTGTVTQRHYIQRVAGQVAEFHHVFGAMVVEIDEDGIWYARQINATTDGTFYDIDTLWTPNGPDDESARLKAITHGDLHGYKIDTEVFNTVFQLGGIVDQLLPKEQYFHDTIDFMPRNYHNIKDPHHLWEMKHTNYDSVEGEFDYSANLLRKAYRPWCRMYVVTSNHDQALLKWLKDTSAFYDVENVAFWLKVNLDTYNEIKAGFPPMPFKNIMTKKAKERGMSLKILGEDDSHFIIGTDIQAALHGHLGPNGARGSPLNLRVVGKANTGHTHSAGIVDGIYTAGVYGKLDMGYNKGPSAWSHSFIVTYPNDKRAIFTIKRGKAWRGQRYQTVI